MDGVEIQNSFVSSLFSCSSFFQEKLKRIQLESTTALRDRTALREEVRDMKEQLQVEDAG